MAYFNPNQPIVQSALTLAPTHLNTQIAKGVLDIMTSKEANDRANAELAMMQELHPERLRQMQLSNTGLELLNDYNTVRNLYADDTFKTNLDFTKANIDSTKASTGLTNENIKAKQLDNATTEFANEMYKRYYNTGSTGSAALDRDMSLVHQGNVAPGYNGNPVNTQAQEMIDTLTANPKAGVATDVTNKMEVKVKGTPTQDNPTAEEVDEVMIGKKPLSKMSKKEQVAARADMTRRHANELIVTLMDGTQMDYRDVPEEKLQEIVVPGQDYSNGVNPFNWVEAKEYYGGIIDQQRAELNAFDKILYKKDYEEQVANEKKTPVEQAMGDPKVYKDYNPSIFDHQDSTKNNRYITGRSKDSMTAEEKEDAVPLTPGSTLYKVGNIAISVPKDLSQEEKQELVDSVSGVFGSSVDIDKLEKIGTVYGENKRGKLQGKAFVTFSDLGSDVNRIVSANDMFGTGLAFNSKVAKNAASYQNKTVENFKAQGDAIFKTVEGLDKPSANEGLKSVQSTLQAIKGEEAFKKLDTLEGKKGKDLFNKEVAIYLAETMPTYLSGEIRFKDSAITRQKFLDAVTTPPEKDESIDAYYNRLGRENKLNFFGDKYSSLGRSFSDFVYAAYKMTEENKTNFMSNSETKRKFRDVDTGHVTEIPYFNDKVLTSVDKYLKNLKRTEAENSSNSYNKSYSNVAKRKIDLTDALINGNTD